VLLGTSGGGTWTVGFAAAAAAAAAAAVASCVCVFAQERAVGQA
jgi:hypothetical protein